MADRFEQTGEEARAAVVRAAARGAAAHRRRLDLDLRIRALRAPEPAYSSAAVQPEVVAARERLAEARRSCELALVRTQRAQAHHRLPAP